MKYNILLPAFLFFIITSARSENLDQAVDRFLVGEKLNAGDYKHIKLPSDKAPAKIDPVLAGDEYMLEIKLSIVDPNNHCVRPLNSHLVSTVRSQKMTYLEIKARYEKNKTPLLAYALVCPALFVDDREILPELFAKIGENQALKTHFDFIYMRFWKARLDPDF